MAIRNRGAWKRVRPAQVWVWASQGRESHLSVVIIAMCAILVASEITSPEVAEEFYELIGWFLRYTGVGLQLIRQRSQECQREL